MYPVIYMAPTGTVAWQRDVPHCFSGVCDARTHPLRVFAQLGYWNMGGRRCGPLVCRAWQRARACGGGGTHRIDLGHVVGVRVRHPERFLVVFGDAIVGDVIGIVRQHEIGNLFEQFRASSPAGTENGNFRSRHRHGDAGGKHGHRRGFAEPVGWCGARTCERICMKSVRGHACVHRTCVASNIGPVAAVCPIFRVS